jgi:alkyldihydroxyacetonephosphate synthase
VGSALSFWAWGRADRFPDLAARRALAEQVEFLTGRAVGPPRDLPVAEKVRLPPPRLAEKARAPVVPFGGGTSVVGGVEPALPAGFNGVVSLDLGRLDRVLEVDEVSRCARVQAGIRGPALEEQLAAHGLTFRHYPQSFEFSTLGGWIATRAAGHFATLATRIDHQVQAVRMLTPRGPYETPRVPSSGAGPAPQGLVLGSEGTLGVITEAWMRVLRPPRWRSRATVFFDGFAAGAHAARELAQSGLFPSNCRLLDPGEALVHGVATGGAAVLLLGFESADHPLDAWMARGLAVAGAHGGRCPDGPSSGERTGDAADAWRDAFFRAPYLQSALVSLGVLADTFETACTWDRFESLHETVVSRVEEALRLHCGAGLLTCRLTHVYPDGAAPYYTFVAPARAGAEIEQWREVKRAAADAVAAAGGTVTHHHAVGRVHRPWYDRERPEPFGRVLRAAKETLDPAGVLNPGVLME